MTNEELKKKIVGILDQATGDWYEKDDGLFAEGYTPEEGDNRFKAFIADALIAAGIGDVKESENKATAAELVAQVSVSTAIKKIAEWKHRAVRAERALHCLARSFAEAMCKDGDTQYLVDGFIKDAYNQAEKQLEEEANND